MTALTGLSQSLTLDLSDEDVQRIAAAVVASVTALVPAWLPARPLSRSEAADWLQVSAETLRRWEREGVLTPARVGEIVRYTPAQLGAFFEGGGAAGARAHRRIVGHQDNDAGR